MLTDVIGLSKKLCTTAIQGELAYASPNNLVGRVLDGYHPDAKHICLLTPKTAQALCEVQNLLDRDYGYGLFVFDGYRPKRAVKDLVNWSTMPYANAFELERKALHYPDLEKKQLFELGYISEDSNHCYGHTVDLTLIDESGNFLEMGTIFDFMGEKSHHTATKEAIGEAAYEHRKILASVMENFGFERYIKEYWHFSLGGAKGREVAEPLDVEINLDLV